MANEPDAAASTWRAYVRRVAEGDSQKEIARQTGVDQGTVSRWLSPETGRTLTAGPESVKKFARGYGRDVLEAFVAAGLLSSDEVDVRVEARPYAEYADEELIRVLKIVTVELSRRLLAT